MQNKSFTGRFLLAFAAIFVAVSAFAGIPERPAKQRLVNDFAGIFTAEQLSALESKLVAFDDTTSNQIAVVTVPDLDGYDPNQYAAELGIKWGVGKNGVNNGIVILVKPKNANGGGKVAIQVGYAFEGAITDAQCKRIIELFMIPRFKENDYFGAIDVACTKLMALASGEISVKRELEEDDDEPKLIHYILSIIFLYFVYKWSMRGGGSGSGGGHYTGGSGGHIFVGPIGGGYSGGHSSGGGFGGGFGGFGGGSFGGGGASGSW